MRPSPYLDEILGAASPELLRYTCCNCDYQFTAPVGTYKVKSGNG